MSRGYIFHVTTDSFAMGTLSASDFYESLNQLQADYTEDASSETANEVLQTNFLSILSRIGFSIDPFSTDDANGYVIHPLDETGVRRAKELYFAPKLKEFQEIATNMTLDRFVDTNTPSDINTVVDNNYTDGVQFENQYGGLFYTMDAFIRRLSPNTEYFVSDNIIFMH